VIIINKILGMSYIQLACVIVFGIVVGLIIFITTPHTDIVKEVPKIEAITMTTNTQTTKHSNSLEFSFIMGIMPLLVVIFALVVIINLIRVTFDGGGRY
jgi:hypothetical protein